MCLYASICYSSKKTGEDTYRVPTVYLQIFICHGGKKTGEDTLIEYLLCADVSLASYRVLYLPCHGGPGRMVTHSSAGKTKVVAAGFLSGWDG